MIKKAIIMDFDGTLANTAMELQKIYNQMATDKGWPEISSSDYRRLRKGTLRQAMKWAGIHPWQLPLLLYKGRKRFLVEGGSIEVFTGMDKLVVDLDDAGWDIYVLSQNSVEAVKKVLSNNKIDGVTVLKRASIFGKYRNIRRFLRTYKYQQQNVWMIGDEVRDIEAAKKAGIKMMAVTWGLQDESILRLAKPDDIANTPEYVSSKLC